VFNPFMEFRMGIRFQANVWRVPLRLINRVLGRRQPSLTASSPMAAPSSSCQPFPPLIRAERPCQAAPQTLTRAAASARLPDRPHCGVRVLRSPPPGAGRRRGMRMVISGRIDDVCAELDRLIAQEQSAQMQLM
jgi:hypothetical protein